MKEVAKNWILLTDFDLKQENEDGYYMVGINNFREFCRKYGLKAKRE